MAEIVFAFLASTPCVIFPFLCIKNRVILSAVGFSASSLLSFRAYAVGDERSGRSAHR